MIINETMMWLNKFTKENIEDDNKKKEHAHRQTESCSNSNAYGSPLGLELEHKIKIEHDHHQIKSCSNSNTIGSQHGVRTRECRLERAMC